MISTSAATTVSSGPTAACEARLLWQPLKQPMTLAWQTPTDIFWLVIPLGAPLGFLLSTVNTHCFTQKKMEPELSAIYSSNKWVVLTVESNHQKLAGTVRVHQVPALPDQTDGPPQILPLIVGLLFSPSGHLTLVSQLLLIFYVTESFLLSFTCFSLALPSWEMKKNRCPQSF